MARLPKPFDTTGSASSRDVPRTDSREKLLVAAIEIFGNVGYSAAGARQLTDAAETNLGAINYHFGSKQGLYLAAFDFISEKLVETMRPANERLAGCLAERTTGKRLLELALSFMEDWVDAVLGVSLVNWRCSYSMMFLRAELESPAQEGGLRNRVLEKACSQFFQVVARIRKLPPEALEVRLLVTALIAQPLLYRPGSDGYSVGPVRNKIDAEFRDAVQSCLRANTAAILCASSRRKVDVG